MRSPDADCRQPATALNDHRGLTPPRPAELLYEEFESQGHALAGALPELLSWHPPRSPFHADSGYLAAHRRPLSSHSSSLTPSSRLATSGEGDCGEGETLTQASVDAEGEEDEVEAEDVISRRWDPSASRRCVVGEYHCVYSSSYRVPVLLFRFDFVDGQPLSAEESTELLQRIGDGRSRSLSSRLTATSADFPPISATLHPALGTPFFSLHPCQTSSMMATLQSVVVHNAPPCLSVLSWLSAVAPFVGFCLPFSHSLQKLLAVDRLDTA